ncbi:MAG: methionyl-tRNA formyltransferase [Methylophilaceae bacterium]|nr:methionyl-tRNA formyltransferase [Methylophilaceae bacterium]
MNIKKISIIFAGTPEFAVPALEKIYLAGFEIKLVLTQPDRKSGRGMNIKKSPVKQKSIELGIPVYQPEVLINNKEAINKITTKKADILIVVAYGLIIPDEILNAYNGHIYNIHASLLPRWRGAAPVHRAIEAGDKEAGITIMKIVNKLDAGPMIMKEKVPISEEDTTDFLSKKLSKLGASMINAFLKNIERGKVIKLEKQNEEDVTYAKKINKLEAIADFNNSPEVLCQKIRAFNPFPMINIDFEGKSLKIVRANIYNKKEITHNLASGKLFLQGEDLLLKLSSGVLKLEEVRLEGKKTMIASDFVKGHQVMKINSVNK